MNRNESKVPPFGPSPDDRSTPVMGVVGQWWAGLTLQLCCSNVRLRYRNANTVLTVNPAFGSGPTWQRPTSILLARFAKIGFQVDFQEMAAMERRRHAVPPSFLLRASVMSWVLAAFSIALVLPAPASAQGGADGEDLALLRFLFRGVGDDDAPDLLLAFLNALNDDAVV